MNAAASGLTAYMHRKRRKGSAARSGACIIVGRSLLGDRNFFAVGAYIPLGRTVAADEGIPDRGDGAELDGHRHADVLGNGENAGAIFQSAADLAAPGSLRVRRSIWS